MGKGYLKIEFFVGSQTLPVGNIRAVVKDTNGNVLYELLSDENGRTEAVALEAPDKADVLDPYSPKIRFGTYNVEVPPQKGYKRIFIYGTQVFDGITSLLPVQMKPALEEGSPEENAEEIFIPKEHGVDLSRDRLEHDTYDLYEDYEYNRFMPRYVGPVEMYDPLSLLPMEIPLANEVAIPEYITVHLGSPNDGAPNYRLPFDQYIKNVASSEIFPQWEETAITANILCQISFALNRIHTLWYRSRGKDFDITNSTAFDQAFVQGREIFENISRIVDHIFNLFLRRQGRREPFFASYCNGTTSQCDGLSQWGSQELAEKGYSVIQILRYYYPEDIQIVESNNFAYNVGIFPGTPLREGSTGEDVSRMQIYLNRISGNWYIPPITDPRGIFQASTKATVTAFQKLFSISADGVIGKSTWYEIIRIYVAAKELGELSSEGERISVGAAPPTVIIQMNARGKYVVELQFLLNFIANFYPLIPSVIQNGVFRDDTKRSVVEFQKQFGLSADGIVGPITWKKLYDVYASINDTVPIPPADPSVPGFPGVPLSLGARGNDVTFMQKKLAAISKFYPSISVLTPDGIFGPITQGAVVAFQKEFGLTPDGAPVVITQRTSLVSN